MRKLGINLAVILFITSAALTLNTKEVVALEGSNYELTNCTINFPDGTIHVGAECTQPLASGPCDRVARCQGGAPPPQFQ